MAFKSLLTITALLAASATAKTDIDGCTSFTSMVTVRPEPGYGNTYASIVWYVPDTLEICKGVDCGGGRAPPKSVPGCPLYKGTETVTPEFLDHDPMKPTAAPVTSDQAKETGSSDDGDDDDDSERESGPQDGKAQNSAKEESEAAAEEEEETSSVAPTTIVTSATKPAENPATTTMGSVEDDDEKSSSSAAEESGETSTSAGAEDDAATTTGSDDPEETGAAAVVGVNMVLGAVAAAFALL